MNELPVVFGGAACLSGVVTVPGRTAATTGLVLLNAGLRHRVGPNRMHVTLARAAAAAGLPSLRFDFSGLGESGSRPDGLSYDEAVLEDARAALDLLAERQGATRFVLYGLCSGADNAFEVALAEPRVAGLVMLQPYSFASRGYALEMNARALLKPANWRRLLRGGLAAADVAARLRSLAPRRAAEEEKPPALESPWRMPPADHIQAGVRALAARGARLLLVYSPPCPAEYNYRRIIRPEAGRAGNRAVRVELFRHSDHNITPLHHQRRLVDLVVGWARELAGEECAPRVSAA